MFCYLLTKNRNVQIRQNNFDNTFIFYFYPLFDAQFVKMETISFGPCNIMISEQNIDVILSICNTYKQLLHCYTPNS